LSQEHDLSPRHIPQHVLDHYHRVYNNHTYRAFTDRLREVASADPTIDDMSIDVASNLLTDAALERSGAECYRGREQSLMRLIGHLGELVTLAQAHLWNFGPAPALHPHSRADQLHTLLHQARQLAEVATRTANDLPSWRGRVAFAWCSAAASLLHAAQAVLIEGHYDSYPLEKLDRGVEQLSNGVAEAKERGLAISGDFAAWLSQRVKAKF
jgi:hypothetical protein